MNSNGHGFEIEFGAEGKFEIQIGIGTDIELISRFRLGWFWDWFEMEFKVWGWNRWMLLTNDYVDHQCQRGCLMVIEIGFVFGAEIEIEIHFENGPEIELKSRFRLGLDFWLDWDLDWTDIEKEMEFKVWGWKKVNADLKCLMLFSNG